MWFRPRAFNGERFHDFKRVSLFFSAKNYMREEKKISTISIPPRAAIFCCLLCHPSTLSLPHMCVLEWLRECFNKRHIMLHSHHVSRIRNDTQNFFSFLHHPQQCSTSSYHLLFTSLTPKHQPMSRVGFPVTTEKSPSTAPH